MRLKNLMRVGEQKHNSSEQGPYCVIMPASYIQHTKILVVITRCRHTAIVMLSQVRQRMSQLHTVTKDVCLQSLDFNCYLVTKVCNLLVYL